MKIILITGLLIQCSDSKNDKPSDGFTTCIVTDKAKLEEITIFPSDNPINADISQEPADLRSDDIIAMLGTPSVHPDFGSGLWEGSDLFISGDPDDRWDNDDLSQLKNINASDFEVVQMGEIIYN